MYKKAKKLCNKEESEWERARSKTQDEVMKLKESGQVRKKIYIKMFLLLFLFFLSLIFWYYTTHFMLAHFFLSYFGNICLCILTGVNVYFFLSFKIIKVLWKKEKKIRWSWWEGMGREVNLSVACKIKYFVLNSRFTDFCTIYK